MFRPLQALCFRPLETALGSSPYRLCVPAPTGQHAPCRLSSPQQPSAAFLAPCYHGPLSPHQSGGSLGPGHAKPAASVRDLQLVAGVVNLSPASSRPRATQGPLWVPLEIATAREHCLQDPGAEKKALVPDWLEQDKTQRPRIVS